MCGLVYNNLTIWKENVEKDFYKFILYMFFSVFHIFMFFYVAFYFLW